MLCRYFEGKGYMILDDEQFRVVANKASFARAVATLVELGFDRNRAIAITVVEPTRTEWNHAWAKMKDKYRSAA